MKPETFLIIKNGIVNDYQTTREQAPWLEWWYDEAGHAGALARLLATPTAGATCSSSACRTSRCCRARRSRAARTSSPPPTAASRSIGDGSFSIDQQRYNAQFGGQVFYEIKGGKIVGMLKDVAYQMRTPDFWNSMDMIGGKKSYEMGGSFFDGKGQPGQIERGESRLRAGALPQHQRHQHREKGMSAPQESLRRAAAPLAATATMMTREQAQALIERVVKMSKADDDRASTSAAATRATSASPPTSMSTPAA